VKSFCPLGEPLLLFLGVCFVDWFSKRHTPPRGVGVILRGGKGGERFVLGVFSSGVWFWGVGGGKKKLAWGGKGVFGFGGGGGGGGCFFLLFVLWIVLEGEGGYPSP